MHSAAARRKQRWLVPEVVQTSAMDCGPATLKCLLEGFYTSVSYGRLREACQTDVDGTSIDTIEVVASQLGVSVEQIMIPSDHVFLSSTQALPAIVVTRRTDNATHFVVVWRRLGSWLQVMDPAIGRRWITCERFAEEVFRHELSVPAAQWRQWAGTDDFLNPLRERLRLLGAEDFEAENLIEQGLYDAGWFALGALDAATRLLQSIVTAGGIKRGTQAVRLLTALFERTCDSTFDIYTLIPPHYWATTPDLANVDSGQQYLSVRGAVLLRTIKAPVAGDAQPREDGRVEPKMSAALSPELTAALREKPLHPMRAVWDFLRADGMLGPLALVGAMSISVGALLIETLLFRGIFDISWMLNQPSQRLGAVIALIAFMLVLMLIEVPIITETLRYGRHLEARLRMALLCKLPRLTDRYFQSRPISDMAERSHSIQMLRLVPAMGLRLIQSVWDLLLTLVGIILIDPGSTATALAIALLAITVSFAAQPLLNERDLRVRNHAGALHGFYLDAMLGLVPIRTHGAEKAVSRQHEGLLVQWAQSSRGLVRMSIAITGVQALVCLGLASYLLMDHFLRAGGVTGGDLLLVYWTLKLPAVGGSIAALARQYPGQRNILLRLLEPLCAPEELHPRTEPASSLPAVVDSTHRSDLPMTGARAAGAMSIRIANGSVLAAGHTILRDINLAVAPGEHIAIVGKSGAGKSTLLGLLLGWHRVAQGALLTDGRRVTAIEQEALRRATAWVDPGIQIWNRSFLDNLAYASEDDGLPRVSSAIDTAKLRSVLQKLPQGLQTYLGEGGGLLSGGEGQRVRLARALLQTDVRLTLLDEPFRGMDRGQRSALLADARQWWADTTLLCVTHDVSETLTFDRVLVIEDGRIVEDGAPAQLAVGNSRYRELLEGETIVREQMWQGRQWRHMHMRDGRIEATPATAPEAVRVVAERAALSARSIV